MRILAQLDNTVDDFILINRNETGMSQFFVEMLEIGGGSSVG